jgi:phosphonatase-like hydrolase
MPIRLAVFDIAGTTINDGDAVADAFILAFSKHNLHVDKSEVKPLMGYKKTLAIEIVLRKLGTEPTPQLVNDIHDEFEQEMIGFYRSSQTVQPMRSAEHIFREMKSKGVKVALNTGFPKAIADVIVDRFGWNKNDLVDTYIASDEVELGRPDPAMISHLMKRTGVEQSSEVLKVGDTEVDVREGRNAGCGLVVAVTTGAFTREQLEPYQPDHIIDDLSELPQIIDRIA